MCKKDLCCKSNVSKVLSNCIRTDRGRSWFAESRKAWTRGKRGSKNLKIVQTSLWIHPTFKVSFFLEERFHEKLFQGRSMVIYQTTE